MYKIVVLISGGGSNLQSIIDNIQTDKLNAEIVAVISNRADAFGLKRAEKANIDNHVLDHTVFGSRESFDESLAQIIDSYEPDLIVLAGFMRILSNEFVEHFQGKLINIHPSLLPKYKGLNTHQRALDSGDEEHGASVHFVIPELDAGTVIIQGVVPVEADDTASELQDRVHKIEHQIYPRAIKYLAEEGLTLEKDQLIYKNNSLIKPFIHYLS